MDNTELANVNQEEFLAATSGGQTFIPNLLLLHPNSEPVSQKKGHAGEFMLGKEINLGEAVELQVLAFRWHAIYLRNGQKDCESFNFNSPVTKKIMAIKKDYNAGHDPRFGYAFLVYIPAVDKFAIFHPNVPSARHVARSIGSMLLRPDRRVENVHDMSMPHTNFVKVYSTERSKPTRHYVPMVEPLDPVPAMSEESIAEQMAMFTAPVTSEAELEEADDQIER